MNRIRNALAAATAVVTLVAAPALAADIAPIIVPAPAPVVVPAPVPTIHDWTGLYVGVYAGFQNNIPPPYAIGGQAGFNLQRGRLVFGVQGRAGVYMPGADFHFNIDGRVGVVLGQQGRMLAYAVGGAGFIPCCLPVHGEIGGGVEFALGNRLSVFGEARTFVFEGIGGLLLRGGVNIHL